MVEKNVFDLYVLFYTFFFCRLLAKEKSTEYKILGANERDSNNANKVRLIDEGVVNFKLDCETLS